ncbi:MAG: topoisomerase DNA-binding C4 zinc finger domain-containing protein [Armatimonadetes bacterium]|nr:topoisomerase DNA-binding C4 zinc finger domain-containing protein [Armatimonadota bacterium]
MARREESIFEMLTEVPWWVGVITAGVLYGLLRYLIPGLVDEDSMTGFLVELPRIFALPVAGLALLASAISAAKSLFAVARGGAKHSPASAGSRPCPRCGSDLVLRRAARGKNAGSDFWGCSDFPKCRYTEDVTK